MGRKVGALLMICLLVALCATQAFAEPTSLSPSQYSFYTHYFTSNTASANTNFYSGNTLPLPSSGELCIWTRDTSGSISTFYDHLYLSNSFTGENGLPYVFVPSTTYHLKYNIHFQEVYPNSLSKLNVSLFRFSSYLGNTAKYDDAFSVNGLKTLSNYNYNAGWTSVSGTTYTLEIAFRTSDVFDGQNFPYCITDIFIPLEALPTGASIGAHAIVQWAYFEATYDPEADVIGDLSDSIVAGQERAAQMIVEGNRQAILDAQDREYEEVNSNADDAADSSQADAANAFNFTAFANALGGLGNALGYTGTDFHFYLPAANNIPYIGNLWSQIEIPFKQYIDMMPVGLLYIIRFLAWLGLLFSVVHTIRKLITDINGGDDK